MDLEKLLQKAIQIACVAHEGQFDKGGKPYILHPLWVMHKVRHLGTAYMIVAVLHDVVEDSGWTIELLAKEGFPVYILQALKLLDHSDQSPYLEEYIPKRVATNLIATEVKMRDLEHNSKPNRLKDIRPKDFERIAKYHQAFKFLKEIKNSLVDNVPDEKMEKPIGWRKMETDFKPPVDYLTWIKEGCLFMVDRLDVVDGKFTDKYRIIPTINDASLIGHINFNDLTFDKLEEAQLKAENL